MRRIKEISIYWYYSAHFTRHNVGQLTRAIIVGKLDTIFRSILSNMNTKFFMGNTSRFKCSRI